jgi:hypothetical protein
MALKYVNCVSRDKLPDYWYSVKYLSVSIPFDFRTESFSPFEQSTIQNKTHISAIHAAKNKSVDWVK